MLERSRLPYPALTGLSATAALILVTELLPVGVLGAMAQSLHVGPGGVALLATGYAAAATVGAIPLTAVTRRLRRRPLLIVVVAGFALGNALTASAPSYDVILGVRVALGLLGGLAWSMIAGYAAAIAPVTQRGRAVAIALAGITIALVAGLPLLTLLAAQTGWRATFLGLGAAGVTLVLWLSATLPPGPHEPARARGQLRAVARRPGVATVLGVTGLLLVGHQAAYTFVGPLARRGGIDRPGLVLLGFGLSALAGITITGALVDRHLRGITLGGLGLVATAQLTLAVAGGRTGPLVAATLVWGLGFGGLPTALQAALVRRTGADAATAAGALQTTVYNVGVATGSLAGGLVADGPGVAAVSWVALPAVLGATALLARDRTGCPGSQGIQPSD